MDTNSYALLPEKIKQTAVLKNNGIDTDNFTNRPDITQLVCNNVLPLCVDSALLHNHENMLFSCDCCYNFSVYFLYQGEQKLQHHFK